jgi:DHA1 family bicyclomycin/chloramphenicol resistance-like MFS transporter
MNSPSKNNFLRILILGSMTALSPFSIDMYLSAFPLMAKFFQTTVAEVSITLSSYFIGLASGQLIYGPLMDRFGRKKPLAIGMIIYIFASLACTFATSIDQLIILRFIQAAGGCSCSVAAFAMVRDLFEPRESAKVLSLLILILGVSPLLAPTIGGYLAVYLGWRSIFFTLVGGASVLLFIVMRFLPESHAGDKSHVLMPLAIMKNYLSIIKEPGFHFFAIAGAMAFSGLFVYLAASPTIFMTIFHVSEQVYGWIFALIAMGLVGMSQLNVVLVRKFTNIQILGGALGLFTVMSFIFVICAYNDWLNLYSVVGILFIFLSCLGLSNPNSMAIAMAPFGNKAGSAASMIGFVQMGIGSLASLCVGVLNVNTLFPIAIIFAVTSTLAFVIYFKGRSVS